MYHTICHLASAIGFVILALPYAGSHDALHSIDDRPAYPAPLTDIAAAPDLAAQQRPQSRIVDQVRSVRMQERQACVRVVPDLTTSSQNAAREALTRLNLNLGRVHGREVNRPRGTIVDQAPKAGTRVACSSPVDIWVAVPVSSQGDDVQPEPLCLVPSLTGNQLDDVRRQLTRAKLEVGKVNTRESDRVRGTVLGQSPASGTRVRCGSPIDVVIAIPVPQRADDVQPEPLCLVPSLTGNQPDDVRRQLARAKLEIGKVNRRESDRARGTVIDQSPASGTRVRCGSPIDVVIAIPVPQRADDVQPEPPCLVPDLTGSGAGETRRQLARAKLELGTVNSRQSDRPLDTVLDQLPRPDRAVKCGSQVDVWIAVAPEKPEPPVVDCRVPNVAGDDVSDVWRKLAQENLLLGTVRNRPTDLRPGTVVDQVPRPGTTVRCGSQIDVWVATPLPCPPVPHLIGRDPKTAAAVLERAGLRIGTVSTRESDQAVGVIVEQVPAAGSDVTCGTSIALWVAAPPIVVRVPPLLGGAATDARRTLEGIGLRLGEIGRRASEEQTGTVVDQLPRPGTLVKPGSAVQVWVATVQPRTVPDLRGRDRSGASDALTTARLRLGETGERPSDDPAGTVVDQSPKAGTTVDPGTSVQVWFAVPRSATVPDLRGRDRNGAIDSLTSAGLRLGDAGERPSDAPFGTVVDQAPPAGTVARVSTPVQVWLAVPVPIEVPRVVGHPQAAATAMLRDRRLRIGSVRSRESAEPRGVVVEQTPQAGQRVAAQTAVDLWIATPRRILVPDLRGRTQADAIGALKNAGLAIGATLERESPEPQGTVADHQPAAGAEVDAGTAVSLWIAVPAQLTLVEVPDVGGRTRSEAERIITERSLALGGATTTESTNASGTIVRQQPSAGMRVTPGTVVNIVLAAAVTEPIVRVPSVAGLSVAEAHDVLLGAGLQPGAVSHARAWATAGTITSQRPEAGSSAQAGATVDLVVASSSAAILWVLAGLGLGVAAAAGVSRLRARNRLPPSVTLAPYADAGIQASVPDDGALADYEISLKSCRDDGVQALQGTLVIGEIAEAR